MSFYYLASPYSQYLYGINAAYWDAGRQTALLVKAGIPVFSPIVHSHHVAEAGHIDPLDHAMWMAVDKPMMDAARGLIVCMLQGWQESKGVRMEIREFERNNKPVIYMTPGRSISGGLRHERRCW